MSQVSVGEDLALVTGLGPPCTSCVSQQHPSSWTHAAYHFLPVASILVEQEAPPIRGQKEGRVYPSGVSIPPTSGLCIAKCHALRWVILRSSSCCLGAQQQPKVATR